MKKYLFIGYNSSGYQSDEKSNFDGTIQKLYKPDPQETSTNIRYFQVTHADGSITDENQNFIDELLLKERGYTESFLVTQVYEINKENLFKVVKEKNIKATLKLIKYGVDVNSKDINGQTPLHIVAKSNDSFGFSQLLEVKADINAKDNNGNTPLDIHIKYENDNNFIEYLLERGATKGRSTFMQKILNFFS